MIPSHFHARCEKPPRKVRLASVLHRFSGNFEQRLNALYAHLDKLTAQCQSEPVDLIVFPEHVLQRVDQGTAVERALKWEGDWVDRLGDYARKMTTHLVIPLILDEPEGPTNSAVLIDRSGRRIGTYRKVNPVMDGHGRLEGGIYPGQDYPVFDCDFGRIGILICWDMAYAEAWETLAKQNVELILLPSASPQTVRPAAFAMLYRCPVLTSCPRDNVTLFSPIGTVMARLTTPGILKAEIDLSYAILHWSSGLREGRALQEHYGDAIGYLYSPSEDTGVFWSNDSHYTIAERCRELGLAEMDYFIAQTRQVRRESHGF
jgi:predicted amidohydrolase